MNIFEKLVLKDHFMFHDLTWEMNKHRLSTIRGINMDRDDNSGNATGKSLLPSSVATILNDSPPSAIRKKSAKEGMGPKSDLRLFFSNEHGAFNIHQYIKSSSVKLELFEGDVDLSIKNKTDIRAEIKAKLPISEETFYSQIYISSLRPPAMFNGKASDRLAYFEEVFDMRMYDVLKKRWSKKLTELGKLGSVHKEMVSRRESLYEQVDLKAEKELKKLKGRHSDIMNQYQTTNLEIQKLVSHTVMMEQIEGDLTEKQIKEKIQENKDRLSKGKKILREKKEAKESYDLYVKTKDKKDRLNRELSSLKAENLYIPNARKLIKEQYSAKHGLEGAMESAENMEEDVLRYKELRNDLNGIKPVKESAKFYTKAINKIELRLEQLSKLKAGEPCPLCDHKIPKDHKHGVADLKKSLTAHEAALVLAEKFEEMEALKKKIPKNILRYRKDIFEKELEKVDAEIERLEKAIDCEGRVERITGALEELTISKTAPAEVKESEIDKIENGIEKIKDSINTLENNLRLLEKIEKSGTTLSYKDAKKALKAKKEWVKEVTPEMKSLGEKIDKLTSASVRSRTSLDQIKEIESKLGEMEERLSQKRILEELVKACSHKGVVLIETQALAQSYIDKLNLIAKGCFLEPITFSANVDTAKFDITAHRSGGEGDIRSLCGSERGQFLPISGLALMSLMPSSQRSNLFIMDELDDNMSIPERRVFTDHFIPKVSETIENTVVITPKSMEEFVIPNSEELVLLRKNKITNWAT